MSEWEGAGRVYSEKNLKGVPMRVLVWVAVIVALIVGIWLWRGQMVKEYRPSIDPTRFSTEITNPYFTLAPGAKRVYEAHTDEGTERIEIEATGETKEVMGVTTLVYHDRVTKDGQLFEDTLDYLAQDAEGNVWYFGEDVNNYENGALVDHNGSWLAGINGVQPGIWMLADPIVGSEYRQEYYRGEAEDVGEVTKVDQSVTVREKTYTDCIVIHDSSPIDPKLNEDKTYCPEAGGLVLEENFTTGDRVELIESITGSN